MQQPSTTIMNDQRLAGDAHPTTGEEPTALADAPQFRCSCTPSSSTSTSSVVVTPTPRNAAVRGEINDGFEPSRDEQDRCIADECGQQQLVTTTGIESSVAPSSQLFALTCHRDVETRQLQQALERCCQSTNLPEQAASTTPKVVPLDGYRGELILVTGPSGCGKTSLVESVVTSALRMRRRTRTNEAMTGGRTCPSDGSGGNYDGGSDHDTDAFGGLMVSGKFDQLERREQYYAIVQAITELTHIVTRELSSKALRHARMLLAPHREAVRIVADLVPELWSLLNADEAAGLDDVDPRRSPTVPATASPEGGTVARERLQLGLRTLFTALCSPETPIVLFLDDLQWAEPASLDVLASLFTERIPGLVIIGACRDNEVDPSSYLCLILRELEARDVAITQIMVSNVEPAALTAALGDALGAGSDSNASGLARILYERTSGNMFHVTQLVRYLVNDGVIYQPSRSAPWSFDSEALVLDAIRLAPDVVSLLALVIRKQQREIQDMLMVASCLGAEFTELVLRASVTFDVTDAIQGAEALQFLKRSSHDEQTWRFVHDRIQESAYSLIPIHEREEVHLRIGRNLWKALSLQELDVYAHVVVKQLRIGVRLITEAAERELLAALLLRAGELAALASAHATAHEYVTLGMQLLVPRHWRDQYTLSLALYNAAAEIEYCLGNFERMDALVVEIMENARGMKDKVRAQTARIYSLGSRNELDQAINVGLWTLDDFFGERLPAKPTAVPILTDLWRTKRLLRRYSDDALMSIPTVNDFETLASMRIMCLLLTYAVLSRPTLTPVLAMRIVQKSLRRGLCGMSSIGFGYYGTVLSMFFNDVDGGNRYGRIALQIVDRFDAVEQLARVSTAVHCFCVSHTKPLPELLSPLRLAHRIGMGSGDIEHSLLAAGVYAMVALHASRHLSDVFDDVSSFLALTKVYNHSGTDVMFRPLAQFIQCLRGRAANPSVLTGEYLEWESALCAAKQTNHGAAASMIWTGKLVLESLFRTSTPPGVAEATAAELTQPGSGFETAPCFMKALVWLHQGLACLAQSHNDGFWFRSRLRRARQCHRKLVQLSRHSQTNYGGKALLLGAEILVTTGKYHQGLLQYDAAITLSKDAEAWCDAGLACELLSWALQSRGRSDESLIYLRQASRYYERWGADAKVSELKDALKARRGVVSAS